ncbi:MAG: two-component regulator propeller domain-containing protein, partial [Bacteroidota bacterium]
MYIPCAFFLSFASAQSSFVDFRFSHLSVDDGLPDNMVSCMQIDQSGFLWIGTNKGLARYDGNGFKIFSHQVEDSSGLPANIIRSIQEDSEGMLWLGTIGAGLVQFDPREESFQEYEYIIEDPFSEGKDVPAMIFDKEENIWMGTFGCGLQYFDRKKELFKRYNLVENLKTNGEKFQKNTVHSLLEDYGNSKRLWLGSSQGLYLFDKETEEMKRMPILYQGQTYEDISILSLYMEEPDILWIGTWRMGLARYNIQTDEWSLFIPNNEEFEKNNYFSNIINDVQRKSEEELWLSSQDQGLFIFNERSEAFHKISHDPTNPYSIGSEKVNGIYQSEGNRIWVYNFQKGISYLDPTQQYFQFRPLNHEAYCGELDTHVFDFAKNSQSGEFYISTVGCERLFVFDKERNLTQSLPLHPGFTVSQEGYHIMISQDQKVWLAGGSASQNEPSLYQYDPLSRQLKSLDLMLADSISIHSFKFSDIIEDSKGNIWLSTYSGGLLCLEADKKQISQYIATEKRLDAIDKGTAISMLELSKDGQIWISTLQKGVFSFDPESQKFTHYAGSGEQKNKLRGNRVMALEEDTAGRIWAGLST